MITDQDRSDLADLAMRALDTIIEEYGEESAELLAASLVFEVKAPDAAGEPLYHCNYKSLERNSPQHIGGLLYGSAMHILAPE